jgi:hypothetical protein
VRALRLLAVLLAVLRVMRAGRVGMSSSGSEPGCLRVGMVAQFFLMKAASERNSSAALELGAYFSTGSE